MRIVVGRGNKRNTFDLPCATIVNRSPKAEQVQARDLVCSLLRIPVLAEESHA